MLQRRAMLIGLCVAVASCGAGDGDDTTAPITPPAGVTEEPDVKPPSTKPEVTEPATDEILQALVGHYASSIALRTLQEVPVMGTVGSTATTLGLVEIYQEGDELMMSERPCTVVSPQDGAVKSEVPDAFTRSIAADGFPLSVWEEGAELHLERADALIVNGALLTSPATEALPTAADDPRVCDQDGDGNPGVTVRVSGLVAGEIYLVQRRVATYAGVRQADGTVTGTHVEVSSEQSILATTNPVLDMDVPTQQDPDLSTSPLFLRPIDPGYDCDRLVTEQTALFP